MAVDNWHQWISAPVLNAWSVGIFAYSIVFLLIVYILTELYSIYDHFRHERRLVMIVTMPGIDQREFGNATIYMAEAKDVEGEEMKAQITQRKERVNPGPAPTATTSTSTA